MSCLYITVVRCIHFLVLGKNFLVLFQVSGFHLYLNCAFNAFWVTHFLSTCNRYIFFVTLLSIPESSFSVAFKMFDVNNDG